jgi:hypothetical protein
MVSTSVRNRVSRSWSLRSRTVQMSPPLSVAETTWSSGKVVPSARSPVVRPC